MCEAPADAIDDFCDEEGETRQEARADRCFEEWDKDGIIWRSEDESARGDDEPASPWGAASGGSLAVADREPIAIVARRHSHAQRGYLSMNTRRPKVEPQPGAWRAPTPATPGGRGFGGWWLSGCLLLAALFGGGVPGSSRPETPTPVAARSPANKPIEYISVGARVVTDASPRPPAGEGRGVRAAGTAVDPKTWKKLVLLAVTHWDNGTRDEIKIETLQPPEWVKQNDVRIGATVPLPLDLVEMGLPHDLRATVLAIERCPDIRGGPGRVVLTTVNHLNKYIFELTINDAARHSESVHTTGFHKFFSATRNAWVSAAELRNGERLRGVNGALTVAGLASLRGVHRVYNMTVEDEHVYRVSALGVLVHNDGCLGGEAGGTGEGYPPCTQMEAAAVRGPPDARGSCHQLGRVQVRLAAHSIAP